MNKFDEITITLENAPELLKQKNEEAFQFIFDNYSKMVFAYCSKFISNTKDIEDCMQEVFLHLLEKIYTFDSSRGTFSSWFISLTLNFVRNYVRDNRVHKSTYLLTDEEVLLISVDSTVDYDLMIEDIKNLIGNIEFKIIVLKVGYELSYREISKLVGMSESTCRRVFNKNYEIVKKYLSKD